MTQTLLVVGKLPIQFADDLAALPQQGIDVVAIDPQQLSLVGTGFDCALLDGSQKPAVLMAQISQIKALTNNCKLMVALPDSMLDAVTYLQAGVCGLLNRSYGAEQLAGIIRSIADGHIYLDHDLAQVLAMRQIKKMLEPFSALSSREFDVFCLIAEDCSLQTIAEQLGVSSKTVSNCQSQIKTKLGLEGRPQIVLLARNNGLIS